MSKKKFYEDTGFWAGVGAYYGLSWIFMFYPAFVMGVICGLEGAWVESREEEILSGLGAMIVSYIVLWLLKINRQYFVLLVIYILFALPFIGLLMQYWNHVTIEGNIDAYGTSY